MDFDTICPAAARNLHLAAGLRSLCLVYQRVETDENSFCASARDHADPAFGCGKGCGSCCDRFIPDILPVEADYLALWLLMSSPALASCILAQPERPDLWGPGGKSRPAGLNLHGRIGGMAGCPLRWAAPEAGKGHCAAYPGRPLVCRLFGFAGVYDKDGKPSYALCACMKHLPRRLKRRFSGTELASVFGRIPPIMSDYGEQIVALDPDGGTERAPLPEILPKSLEKVALELHMAGVSMDAGAQAPGGRPKAPGAPEAA